MRLRPSYPIVAAETKRSDAEAPDPQFFAFSLLSHQRMMRGAFASFAMELVSGSAD